MMIKSFKIADLPIGTEHPPFVIAEMSGNHNHSLDRALKIVDAAAASGAKGLKIQTFTADTMTINSSNPDFTISDPNSLWVGSTLYDLYEKAHTPWDWHKTIFDHAISLGLIPFSSPFDATAVDFLETLNVPCYKIASFENVDLPLIKRVANTGKPVIISTGMATCGELEETVKVARSHGCKDLVLLKCTSTYPASPENSNLVTIPHMRQLFQTQVGLSDHTLGIGVAVASVVLGATVIEKHFTIDRSEGGLDADFSLEPDEFSQLVVEVEKAWKSQGAVVYGPTKNEEKSKIFRRSIYITKDLKAGELLSVDNVRCIRPGHGLSPKYFERVLGKRVNRDLRSGTGLRWEHLEY